MNADGTNKVQLTAERGWRHEHPQWTTDGGASIWMIAVDPLDLPDHNYGYMAWNRVMALSPAP